MGVNFPPDLKPQWEDVVKDLHSVCRRCQGMARRQEGIAAVRLTVFVNEDGAPIAWTEPSMIRLEPKARVTPETLSLLVEWAQGMGLDLGDVVSGIECPQT